MDGMQSEGNRRESKDMTEEWLGQVGEWKRHWWPDDYDNNGGDAALKWRVSHQSEWLRSKSLQIINAGEGVEKREPSYTVGGNAN